MFYGAGAGKLPTASAVVADVVDEAAIWIAALMRHWTKENTTALREPFDEVTGRFFVPNQKR